jgi:hypothetical protein
MKTNQPVWKLVANLGDANPLEYGGLFVLRDETGIYHGEIVKIEPPSEDFSDYSTDSNWSDAARWTVWRAVCEPCTYMDGILSDNRHHPGLAAWFADSAPALCDTMGCEESEFRRMITTGDDCERAHAWAMVGDYHGWNNLDGYPRKMTIEEARKLIAELAD